MVRKLGLLFLLGNVIWFAACGGNGGGNNGSSTVTAVSVSCPSPISSGGTGQCSATVSGTGSFSTAVTWSASAGSISSSGLFTAPTVSTQTSVTVTATSVQNTSVSGSATVVVNPGGSGGNNSAQLIVDSGPPAGGGEVNLAYTTVTVCVSGTNQCQTIDHVQVDTGSEGLRLLSSASGGEFSLPLTQETISGNPVDECLNFADGYVWGPVMSGDVTVAGETASNIPVHVLIPSSSSPPVPSSCVNESMGSNGNEGQSVMALGANGILGVGPFQNDCGGYCQSQGASCNGTSSMPCVYYQCPSSGCFGTNVPLQQQVPNPVFDFAADNNGVLIQLPSVPSGGATNVQGSLIFGINTESNNSLSLSGNVYQIPNTGSNAGNLITTYNGQSYNESFLDSGSNGLYFLDTSLTQIPTCAGMESGFYCPSSPVNVTATNQGEDMNGNPIGNSGPANFTIDNANNLNGQTAYSTLGGPYFTACGTGNNPPCAFDFGLPFFFGKNVFTAIDGAAVSGAPAGPFFAY